MCFFRPYFLVVSHHLHCLDWCFLAPPVGMEFYFFGGLSGTVSAGSIFIEASLHRWPIKKRLRNISFAGGIAFGIYLLLGPFCSWISQGLLYFILPDNTESIEHASNNYLVSLQHTLDSFVACGISTSIATFLMRSEKTRMVFFNHLTSGLHAALFSAIFWTAFHSFFPFFTWLGLTYHLYWAGFAGCIIFGFFFGLGSWSNSHFFVCRVDTSTFGVSIWPSSSH